MAKQPMISPELEEICLAEGRRQLAPGYQPTIHDQRRANLSLGLLKFAETQHRYGLDQQQTPAEFARAVRNSPNSRAAELDRLTQDQLLEMQAELTADYPGKPS